MTPEQYCREQAAPAGSNVYYSSLFEPAETKQALYALFALHHEINHCLLMTTDPGVTQIKLQWWRDEIRRLPADQAHHPISIQLLNVIKKTGITTASLLTYLDAMTALTIVDPDMTMETWFARICTAPAELCHCIARVLNYQDPQTLAITATNGGLITFLEFLQNLRPLIRHGYAPLPHTLLSEYGPGDHEMVLAPEPEAVRKLFTMLTERLRIELDDCFRNFPQADRKNFLFCIIMNRLATACCEEIRNDGNHLLEHRISLTPIRKLWIAWKTKLANYKY